ncbi:MAG: BMP family ABC transporter substrate-binding protein [Anaerolineae bacterium]|nr:BMP family ABC transporter substrate-binding protein [Anaerolineae bacterium]MDW8171586.1 BMP family ABC transporter substrate-binding protein [Anaerolineae bacterium]
MKRFTLAALVLGVVAMLSMPATAQDEFIFGMILVGPRNDRGWSQAHFEGGLYVEQNMPGAKMLLFESLNPADAPEATLESVAADMIEQGAKLILTTSDSFEKDTDAVAAKYPDVIFVNMSGSNALEIKAHDLFGGEAEEENTPPNVGNIMPQMEWDKLVAGCAAALMTETGSIGYLGPLINAETRRFVASAYLGARHCYETYRGKPADELTFAVTWIGFWFNIPGVTLDPTAEVNTFFDSGADVVISGIDTTEAVVVAGRRASEGQRVFSVAYDNKSGCEEAPESCLGVPYYNWGIAYLELAEAVKAGTYVPEWDWVAPNWDDVNGPSSIVGFLKGQGLSEEASANLDKFTEEMVTFAKANPDAFFLWEGPLSLQDGTPLAAEGEFVDPLKIWYLPQLLEGIIGKSS